MATSVPAPPPANDPAAIAAALRKFSAVVPDYRAPNSIRLAIAPLPTSFVEVWDGFARIRESVANKDYLKIEDNGSRVT